MVMGVTPEVLARHYPRLYHMAELGSWEAIRLHGLLGTEALLKLFDVPAEERELILTRKRAESINIEHRLHGRAVVRDQKPLLQSKLEGALVGCSFQDWLRMLNSRVFFWLTKDRLQTLMCAREYCARPHLVLVLDTLRLTTKFSETITLAPMNTGNTQPFAHPRSLSTFSTMADYPFEERLHRGPYYTVVELAVAGGVPNIMDYVTEASVMQCSRCEKSDSQSINAIERLYP
jgi:hypothetical protein